MRSPATFRIMSNVSASARINRAAACNTADTERVPTATTETAPTAITTTLPTATTETALAAITATVPTAITANVDVNPLTSAILNATNTRLYANTRMKVTVN